MKRFGLIGHPIAHSLSPLLFRAAYGGRYSYDLIEGSDFGASWERFLEEYDGINVTAPFKDLACEKADLLPVEVSAIGASNLLVKTPAGIGAHNSDYLAVVRILRSLDFSVRRVLVVGCGGAAKAAAAATYMLEKEVIIANRSVDKAQDFADGLELFGIGRVCSAGGSISVCGLDDMPRSCDVCIYCLPLAVDGIDRLDARVFVEANYRDPAYSGDFFAVKGTCYIPGEQWLLLQAVTGYGLLTGEEPDVEAMTEAIRNI